MISATILADSVNSYNDERLTTMEVVLHRTMLPQLSKHRKFSISASSNRAISVERNLSEVAGNPAWPVEWPREWKGMSGGPALEGQDLLDARTLFSQVHEYTTRAIEYYLDMHPNVRLHKSLVNRLMEPFQWEVCVLSSTEWQNFFSLRCAEDAQPEIRDLALLMRQAYEESQPALLKVREWHRPKVDDEDWTWAKGDDTVLNNLSAARCARTSFLSVGQGAQKDLDLANRLIDLRHTVPFEHIATPNPGDYGKEYEGNFDGWMQLRKIMEGKGIL